MIAELFGHHARYRSPLPPDACVARLAAVLVPADDIAFADDGADAAFAGTVTARTLHIARRDRDRRQDSEFGLYARIVGDGPGTLIRGRFRVAERTRTYLIGWVASLVLFAGWVLWFPGFSTLGRIVLAAPALAMLLIVATISWLHRGRLARDEAAITALLGETIDARRYRRADRKRS